MEQGRQDRRLPARLGLHRAGRVAAALVLSLELCLAAFANVEAQNFPVRPVRLVVNLPAGSGTADAVARALSEYLTRKWGQPVTVDNIPGATGLVGAEAAYRAEPDGYTLLVTPAGALTVAQHLQKLAYDPTRFVPISMLETSPIVLVASPHLAAKTVPELIAYARANPGKLSVANHGIGSSSHLAAEWFRSAAGVKVMHVPFRGSVAALRGLSEGRVDVLFDNLGSSLEPIRNGQVKALAVASEKPERAARGSGYRANVAGIRYLVMGRGGRSTQNAARPGQMVEWGICQRAAAAADQAGAGRPRLRAGRRHAGGDQCIHSQGKRTLEIGHPGRQDQPVNGGLSKTRAFIPRGAQRLSGLHNPRRNDTAGRPRNGCARFSAGVQSAATA